MVIASVNGLPYISDCLTALLHQTGGVNHEIIVVDRCGESTAQVIRERFSRSHLSFIAAEPRTSIPRLRAMGMERANGQTLAILEDHCRVGPNWLQVIARTRSEGHRVIGGAVANGAVERLRDWAAFFCEYAAFMPPVPRGQVSAITGNNCAYERELLDALGEDLYQEVWEYFLHARLRKQGAPFWSEPELLASHDKRFGVGYFLTQRYHYSRSFVAMRVGGWPRWQRVAYACAAMALPPLLLVRMIQSVYAKQRYRREFLLSLPLILFYLFGGALGEVVGALGGPGASLEKVD